MIWKKLKNIENTHLETITKDFLFSYGILDLNSHKFEVREVDNYQIINSIDLERDFNYEIGVNNSIYFACDNQIRRYFIESNVLEICIDTKEDYITIVSDSFFIKSIYNSSTKSYINNLIDKKNNIVKAFCCFESFREFTDEYIISLNESNNEIGLFDLKKEEYLWSKKLTKELQNDSIFTESKLFIYSSDNFYALDLIDGVVSWSIEKPMLHYSFDAGRLYGLNGCEFEIINANTGKEELNSKLDINVVISSHLTYYNEGFLYFSSHLDNNIPVFGAVNVKTGKLDFIQEVKIEGEKSFRIGLEKPIIVGNRLYVKDSLNTLHIFEKTQNEFS